MQPCEICFCEIPVFTECIPPPPPKPEGIATSPPTCCPVDCLGYPQQCYGCIPLLIGAIIICIMSFMWAIVELLQSEKQIDIILHENDDVAKYFKLFHMFVIITFLATCCGFMIGIISRKVQLIQVYVIIAFIFNCICIAIKMMSLAVQIYEGSLMRKSVIVTMFVALWHSSFFYYISVVNSFKYQMWYYPSE